MRDLRKEFREAENFLRQGAVAAAVQQAGRVLEAFLRDTLKELLPKLPPNEATNLNYVLDRIGKGKPVERLTLGELAQVYQEGQVVGAAERFLKRKLDLLANEKLVRGWVDLRNRAAHADAEVSEDEARAFLANLKLLLQQAGILKEPALLKRIPAWWEVAKPHRDIREGRTEMSQFAAKLDQVVSGRAEPEYRDPQTFFARTHMTLGLRNLLSAALRRLSGKGGDGVLHIETAFGGGKTHSLIALYHFFGSGQDFSDFFWAQELLEEQGLTQVPKAKVLTFVGTEADPLGPTPWGLFAQALGKYERMRPYDESRQAPGKGVLRELLGEEPTLILIDEIAEFLCRLVEPGKLAKASEEARAYQSQVFAFVHELTEVATELPNCLLVLTTTTSTAYAEEGERVQQQLRTLVGRMHRLLEPVGSADIYEVIRTRLFEDLGDPAIHEAVAEEFHKLYRDQAGNLPEETQDPGYREKLVQAYPFHPELIDVLYNQWGSFPQFQRTRGVLRFLALVVQEAWKKREALPLLRLCDVPLENREIRQHLLSCIGSPYDSVIANDIAGGRELARRLDRESPEELRKHRLAERLATAIFLYSFSGAQKPERGATAARLHLATLTPETPSTAVGDTLLKLEDSLHYLHKRDNRYFFSTELNLNRAVAEAQEAVEEGQILEEIRRLVEKKVGTESPILEREIWPDAPEKVPDRRDHHTLVVLGPDLIHGDPKTKDFVDTLFKKAGTGFRVYPGALLVLAPDREWLFALRNNVKRILALREVQRARANELSPEDRERLTRDLRHAEADAADFVVRVWRHLALWRGAEETEWITLSPYARPGLTLASMVVEHLKNANRLTEKLAPDMLLRFCPIGEERAYKDVWEAFLREPGKPIVAERTVREAVKEGVKAGRFGLRVDDKVYFKQDVPDAHLGEAVLIPADQIQLPSVSEEKQQGTAPTLPTAGPTIAAPPRPRPKREYRLVVKVPSDKFSDIFRGVILPLRQNAEELEIEIRVRARREEGFPEDVIERTVRETLRQLPVEVREERLE